MKHTKCWVGFLMVLNVAFGVMTVLAGTEIVNGVSWEYEVNEGCEAIIIHGPDQGDVTIPSELGGVPVREIQSKTFYNCAGLTSVLIPEGLTNIGYAAFSGCSGLTSATLPNSMLRLENSVFSGCSNLTLVTMPETLKSIGNNVFEKCSKLPAVTIPNSVTNIGNSAFSEGCDFKLLNGNG